MNSYMSYVVSLVFIGLGAFRLSEGSQFGWFFIAYGVVSLGWKLYSNSKRKA